ncbi:hypothetical protein QTP70_004677 [Hemibagrus guttatus]|uniref:PDZ domain-containing protein 11 n=1 Tax=Hemibagrus guttatus TaxID=175788 RepID=A0AAE0QVQ2_9TELE|nr:hypothetical protein QTP70_004677 [Hemibagrus guttatus]
MQLLLDNSNCFQMWSHIAIDFVMGLPPSNGLTPFQVVYGYQPPLFESQEKEYSDVCQSSSMTVSSSLETSPSPAIERINHPDYNNELTQFLPRTIILKKPPGAQLGFNIRGGKASQLGIFISKVVPDSDAHRAGLQEGDQVLSVNEVDFQDIEHSKAVEILKSAREIVMRVRYFPYNYQRQKERTVH